MVEARQAILFDFDGTLVDSLPVWEEVDRIFCDRHGLDFEANEIDFGGRSFSECVTYIKDFFSLPQSEDDIRNEWIELSESLYETEITLKPYVKEFVTATKQQGWLTAIGTSNDHAIVRPVLKRFGIDDLFDQILTCCDVGRGKPHPDIYLTLADILHVKQDRCTVFEDTFEGVSAGKNAGMFVYAVEEPCNLDKRDMIIQTADRFISGFDYFKNDLHDLSAVL